MGSAQMPLGGYQGLVLLTLANLVRLADTLYRRIWNHHSKTSPLPDRVPASRDLADRHGLARFSELYCQLYKFPGHVDSQGRPSWLKIVCQ